MTQYYVDNAGLVLMCPHLSEFFFRLNIVDDQGRFLGEMQRSWGARALIRLGEAEHDLQEQDFILGKALCAIPHGVSILKLPAPDYRKSDKFHYERLNFFRSFLDNNIPDNNLPTDVFVEKYLRRRGLLHTDSFTLEVEPSEDDALLQELIASQDKVRLPWLERPLDIVWAINRAHQDNSLEYSK